MLPVRVSIHTRQELDGETDEIRQEAVGTLEETPKGLLLRYDDPRADSDAPVANTMRFGEGEIRVLRTGAMAGEMYFCPGKRHKLAYGTPYGVMELILETSYLKHDLTAQGGRGMIRYTLASGGQLLGSYTMKFNIKKDD